MNTLFAPIVTDLSGLTVLLTAGPTQEAIDPVRYISNHSTGKMGYALAEVLAERGATVTLVTLIHRHGAIHRFGLKDKRAVAHDIADQVSFELHQSIIH